MRMLLGFVGIMIDFLFFCFVFGRMHLRIWHFGITYTFVCLLSLRSEPKSGPALGSAVQGQIQHLPGDIGFILRRRVSDSNNVYY
jgi:hypothetical protein